MMFGSKNQAKSLKRFEICGKPQACGRSIKRSCVPVTEVLLPVYLYSVGNNEGLGDADAGDRIRVSDITMAKSPVNFNIYEVLEPLKCSLTASKDENVGVLIDITDTEDLSGSHLDSIKKSEFDLVDLFQNIYVTPQHVKKLKEDKPITVDYKESQETEGKQESKCEKALKPLNEADINELLNRSDQNEIDGQEKSSSMLQEDVLYKYAIPKILKVPELYDSNSKLVIQNTAANDIRKNVPEKFTKPTTDFDCYIMEKVVKDLTENKMVEAKPNQTNCTASNVLPAKSEDCHNDILRKVAKELLAKKKTETTLQRANGAQSIGNSALSLNKLPKVENFETLQTAKFDKKLYAKRHVTKSEREKMLYTKGPDLYEKSVVLPQIMKRLAIRKQELDEVQLPRRLILDSGKRPDCSYECAHKIAVNSINERKETTKVIESPVVGKNVSAPVRNLSREPLPSEVGSLDTVKINPIVAMEDCNKERLIAHRTRSAFERFVLTGSYF